VVSRQQRPTQAELGTVIRILRHEHDLTIEELAHRAELHPTYVSGIERGRNNPTLEAMAKLADALELRLSDLIRRAETTAGAGAG
jgi:transcriptional regulator with XRE-family HTH domain